MATFVWQGNLGSNPSNPDDLADPLNWGAPGGPLPQSGDIVEFGTPVNTPQTALFGTLTADVVFASGWFFSQATITANDIQGQAEFDQSFLTAQTIENIQLSNNTIATVSQSVGVNLLAGNTQGVVYVTTGATLNADSTPQERSQNVEVGNGGTFNGSIASILFVGANATANVAEVTDDDPNVGANVTGLGNLAVNSVSGGTLTVTGSIVNAGTLFATLASLPPSTPLTLLSVGEEVAVSNGSKIDPTQPSTATALSIYSAASAQYGLYVDVTGSTTGAAASLTVDNYDDNSDTPAGLTNQLTIGNGGVVTINDSIGIGRQVGDHSTVTITGFNSISNTGSQLVYNGSALFTVGDAGTGTLQVQNGASETLPNLTTGDQQSGTGNVEISGSGSTLTVSGTVTIGGGGTGTVTIETGSAATFSGDVIVGDLTTGKGTLSVSGSGSTLTTDSSVVIGADGAVSATVSGGADFDAAASAVSVDGNSNANTLNINGSGSTMEAGSLSVDTTGADLGMVVVNGGSLTVSEDLNLGTQVAGELQVSNTGTLTVEGNIQIGGLNGSDGYGSLQILSDSNFEWNGDFIIGGPNQMGQLLISGGGTAAPKTGSSHGSIDVIGPTSIVDVEGAGSQLSVQSLTLANDPVLTTDSQGVIIVGGGDEGGATTSSAGSILVNPGGSITGIGKLGTKGTLTIIDNGTIESQNPSAGYSDLYLAATAVTGSGQVLIGTNTTLTLNATDTALAITFAGATARLELKQPSQFSAPLAGLQVGDSIQLDGTTVTAADLNAEAGSLSVAASTGNLTFDVAGSLDGNQFDISNSNGNAVLTLEPQGQQPPPPLGPVVTAGNPHVSFTTGGSPVMLDSGLSVVDGESGTLIGATVHVSGGTFANDGDALSVVTAATSIAASYDSTDETLTLSGIATVAEYQGLLQKVVFTSTAGDPTEGGADTSRTITWTVTDGIASSSPVTTTLNIDVAPIAMNDLASVQVGKVLTVSAAAGVLANDTDPDGSHLTVSGINGGTVGHAVAGKYGALVLNSDGSYTYTETAPASALPNGGVGVDVFTYTASDGNGGSAQANLEIAITPTNQQSVTGTVGHNLVGSNGPEVLDGTMLSNQTISGGNGQNTILAGNNDTVVGGNGTSTILAGSNDQITAGNGSTTIYADNHDTITLGNGADTVYMGTGTTVTAGKGSESFVFGLQTGSAPVGHAEILQFRPNQDLLEFNHTIFGSFTAVQAHMSQSGSNTVISIDASDTITLSGIAMSSLHASNFEFL